MFNPFDKPIDSLREEDLQALIEREVAEGLYVEYKREFPVNDKIGQSVASFANTYGGWYMVGIEADRRTNTAQALVGIDLALENDPVSKVRDVAKSHIDPFPAFEPKLVQLSNGRSVLVLEIPGSQDKPFISRNGRIYRRAADSSEPVFEKDRYTIDQLYDEGKKFEKGFRKRLAEESDLTPDDQRGWLRLLISPYPPCVWKQPEMMLQERVAELLKSSSEPRTIGYYSSTDGWKGTMPFDTAFPTGTSIILRQRATNQVGLMSVSVELSLDGTAVFEIPIRTDANTPTFLKQIKSPEAQRVLEGHDLLRLIDLGTLSLSLSIASLVTFYQEWLGPQPCVSEFRFAGRVDDVERGVPFFDSDHWAQYVREFGFPVCHKRRLFVPGRLWWWWEPKMDAPLWQIIALYISYALGIPESLHRHVLAEALTDPLNSVTSYDINSEGGHAS